MAHSNQLFHAAAFFLLIGGVLLLATMTTGLPSPAEKSETKIRIHVPVKHHTHYHTRTKTVVKEVHVPQPHKKTKKPHEEHHHHHAPKYSHDIVELHHSASASAPSSPSAPASAAAGKHGYGQSHVAAHQQKRLADLFDDADIAEELGFTAAELEELYTPKQSKSKKQRKNGGSPYY